MSTITAIAYDDKFRTLYLGDNEGYLRIYRVQIGSKQIEFEELDLIKAHDLKINCISICKKATLFCTSS